VDIHTHILPALDDGPRDLDVAVALVRAAVADGTSVLVATSHSDEVRALRLDRTRLESRLDVVRQAVAGAGIAVNLLTGVEVHLEQASVQHLLSGNVCTLNDSRYVLAEPPMGTLPASFDSTLAHLQQAGFIPVIAHPERNFSVTREFDHLRRWAAQGYVIQLTAASLTGGFGRRSAKVAWEAISQGLAHVVASDAHDALHRPPTLSTAFYDVVQGAGADIATLLFDANPRAILENREPEAPRAVALDTSGTEGLGIFDRIFSRR
jgi:protein-tyrosine phosphatase